MNTRDILNAHLYPVAGQDIRRKDYEYYDALAITTGTLEYFFFTTGLGNQFLRNKELPLAGSEIFFVDQISAYLQVNIQAVALIDDLNELLQQAFIQISVDNRVQSKFPLLDILQYEWNDTAIATGTVEFQNFHKVVRNLPIPIMMNSTSAFEFKVVCNAAVATAFNGINLRLALHGLQLDKLDSFYWDNLKNNQFQQVPVTYYETRAISGAAADTFELFATVVGPLLQSQTFPLSDIQTFSLQNLEVYFNQPNTPIDPTTILNSRMFNVLRISIDDVLYYESNMQNMLSMFAGIAGTLTTTPDTATVTALNIKQSHTLRVPIEFPANGKVRITLEQPASSLGITGEFTVCMRGVETRRVA